MRTWIAPLVLLAPALAIAGARAQIPEVTWQPDEVVDTGVADVSESSGSSLIFFQGTWHLVYVKDRDVVHAWREAGGWLTEPLTALLLPASARAPSLFVTDGLLHVLWEDDRTLASTGVWTRRFDGVAWTAEEPLNEEGTGAHSPAGGGARWNGFAAWVDDAVPGGSIVGAHFEGGSWQAPGPVSVGAIGASQPAVEVDPDLGSVYVAWSDSRHGDAEIYLRVYDGFSQVWESEDRITDIPSTETRPTLHSEGAQFDVVEPRVYIAYESDAFGPTEIWFACYDRGYEPSQAHQVSPLDGVPSTRPNLGGFQHRRLRCEEIFGSEGQTSFLSWTDDIAPGRSLLRVMHAERCPTNNEDVATDLGHVDTHIVVGAVEGDPLAGVALAAIDPTSLALEVRIGTLQGACKHDITSAPGAFLIAPSGLPSNMLTMSESCGGSASGYQLELSMDGGLESQLTIDPGEGPLPHYRTTDAAGDVAFPLRGGGCAASGTVQVRCDFFDLHEWTGVKSPDVDGDCLVEQSDLDYVDAAMGTDDFCADLDGSGLVDDDDRAIVEATLGDACSVVTVGEVVGTAPAALGVFPNPVRAGRGVRIDVAAGGGAHVRVLDVAGRLVRDLGRAGSSPLKWDLLDAAARPVAPGRYVVVVGSGEERVARSLLIGR